MTPMMVVAVLKLHLASFPYPQFAQPDLLLSPPPPPPSLSLFDVSLLARRNLFDEPDEPEEPDECESLSLWDDLPILFP